MSSYIVDTHPLIWLKANKEKKLSKKVRNIFKRVDEGIDNIFIPAPVIWELGFQYRSGTFKIDNYIIFRHWVEGELLKNSNVQFIETALEDVLYASDFKVNKDPFDNLIVATAIRLEMPLITKDESIMSSYACDVVW